MSLARRLNRYEGSLKGIETKLKVLIKFDRMKMDCKVLPVEMVCHNFPKPNSSRMLVLIVLGSLSFTDRLVLSWKTDYVGMAMRVA